MTSRQATTSVATTLILIIFHWFFPYKIGYNENNFIDYIWMGMAIGRRNFIVTIENHIRILAKKKKKKEKLLLSMSIDGNR